jgi:hypothetical protein
VGRGVGVGESASIKPQPVSRAAVRKIRLSTALCHFIWGKIREGPPGNPKKKLLAALDAPSRILKNKLYGLRATLQGIINLPDMVGFNWVQFLSTPRATIGYFCHELTQINTKKEK